MSVRDVKINWAAPCENMSSGINRQRRPRSDCMEHHLKSDQFVMYPHLWGGGHIVFGADPVGVSHDVSITFLSAQYVVGFLPNFNGHVIGT